MSLLSDLTAKLFGGKGTSAPQNQMLMSGGVAGSELYTLLTGSTGANVVTERTALMTSAVYASVGLIGGAIASLPFHIYKRSTDGRERYDTELWWLFNESPTPAWTSAGAWQHTMQSILLKGDSFWTIERASPYSPQIIGFVPHHPDNVVVKRNDNGSNNYQVTYFGVVKTYHQDDVLHFTGLGFNGMRSMTPISYALMTAAGTSLSADEYASQFFKGGARPDHALVVPAGVNLSQEQKDNLKNGWGKQRSNFSSAGTTPVLTGGMTVVPLTLNAQDSQLLETRQFGVEEIARIFGVPPHMIGKTDASTSWGSGIEQMSIGFVRYTLRRHLDVIQQEINRKIYPRSKMFYGEFSVDALMDGDSKAQVEYFSKALGGPGAQGFMTINEVRKLKNLRPVADGDKLIMSSQQPTPESQKAQQDKQQQQADKQKAQQDSFLKAVEDVGRRVDAVASSNESQIQGVINQIAAQPAPAPVINVEAPIVNVTLPKQDAPVVNVSNHLPETTVNVEAVMPSQDSPVVNITNEVKTPNVLVDAPKVTIENNTTVQPAQVEVSLPDRKTETTIRRDKNGEITSTTQIETDI